MNKIIIPIFLGVGLAGLAASVSSAPPQDRPGQGPADPVVKHVQADQAAKLLQEQQDLAVLDIRTPEEFKAGHLPGAVNIDFNGKNFASELKKLDKSKPYLVHCATGRRSTKSLQTFQDLKFQSIYHLDGGIKGWQNSGRAVTKE